MYTDNQNDYLAPELKSSIIDGESELQSQKGSGPSLFRRSTIRALPHLGTTAYFMHVQNEKNKTQKRKHGTPSTIHSLSKSHHTSMTNPPATHLNSQLIGLSNIAKTVKTTTRMVRDLSTLIYFFTGKKNSNTLPRNVLGYFIKTSGLALDVVKTLLHHPIGKSTLHEIEQHRIKYTIEYQLQTSTRHQKHDLHVDHEKPPIICKMNPTVNTFGAIEILLDYLDNLYGHNAILEQNTEPTVAFLTILKTIHEITGTITNEELVTILQTLETMFATLAVTCKPIKTTNLSTRSLSSSVQHLIMKAFVVDTDKYTKELQSTLFTIRWGIYIIQKYDEIEKREVAKRLKHYSKTMNTFDGKTCATS